MLLWSNYSHFIKLDHFQNHNKDYSTMRNLIKSIYLAWYSFVLIYMEMYIS